MTVKQADKQADRPAGRPAGKQEVSPLITARVSLSVDESASNIRWRGNYMTAIISSGL